MQPPPASLGDPSPVVSFPLSQYSTEVILGPPPPLDAFPPPSPHFPPSSCHWRESVEDTKQKSSKSLASHPDGQRLPDSPLSMAHSHLKLNTSKTKPSPPLQTCSFPLFPLHCAWGFCCGASELSGSHACPSSIPTVGCQGQRPCQ